MFERSSLHATADLWMVQRWVTVVEFHPSNSGGVNDDATAAFYSGIPQLGLTEYGVTMTTASIGVALLS